MSNTQASTQESVAETIQQDTQEDANTTSKAKEQLSQSWGEAVDEFKRVTTSLGVDWSDDDLNASKALTQLREQNPDIKTLFRNIDTATFETRAKLKWNTRMALRYARLESRKQFQSTVTPKLHQAKDQLLQTSEQLSEKLEEMKARFNKAS